MTKVSNILMAASLLLITGQQYCSATDFDSLSPPATSVSGAGGNNAGQVSLAISQSDQISEASKHVNVVYKNDAIIITGTVASDHDREELGTIASKCGCVNVRNEVTVAKTASKKQSNAHKSKTIIIRH